MSHGPIFDHNHPKTSNNKHDWTSVKYQNVLHHNRARKQLQYYKNISNFLFWVLWTCLAFSIKNENTNFDFYLHEKMNSTPNFFEILQRFSNFIL